MRALLLRGMLAGLIASAFAWIVGEPQIAVAISFEYEAQQAAGEAAVPELVSRSIQSTLGLLTGVVIYASALGGVFAVAFAYAYGRIGALRPRGTAALLAAAGFVVLVFVPQIKYPANPPAVGDPATIGPRTALYFTMMAISVLTAVAATSTARQLLRRLGTWNSALTAGAAYLIVITAAMLILRPVNEVPRDFPATTLWSFRLASLGIEAVLWAVLGLTFGELVERLLDPREDSHRRIAGGAR
jgi:hypothetical protein